MFAVGITVKTKILTASQAASVHSDGVVFHSELDLWKMKQMRSHSRRLQSWHGRAAVSISGDRGAARRMLPDQNRNLSAPGYATNGASHRIRHATWKESAWYWEPQSDGAALHFPVADRKPKHREPHGLLQGRANSG